MEHGDGGILDLDDILCDVADDKDRVSPWWGQSAVKAVFQAERVAGRSPPFCART